jgi:hypothetical protein
LDEGAKTVDKEDVDDEEVDTSWMGLFRKLGLKLQVLNSTLTENGRIFLALEL